MPSKEFLAFSAQRMMGPPPCEVSPDALPEEFARLGIPMVGPDYMPPEPEIPQGYTGGKVTVGGVDGLHITRPGARQGVAHMHIHGGGYTIGSAMTNGELLAEFLEGTGLEGYSVEYGLAPWHPYPQGLNDCLNFYKGLLDMGYEKIVVGGESAGGGLTLSLVHALKEQGLPLPAAIWCSSPAVDLCFDQKELFLRDMMLSTSEGIRQAYAPGADLEDPKVSPAFGDFTGFPTMYIQAGGGECLSASIVRMAAAAMKANNEVYFHFGQDMPHTFALDYKSYPEARHAMDDLIAFINRTLALMEE